MSQRQEKDENLAPNQLDINPGVSELQAGPTFNIDVNFEICNISFQNMNDNY